MKRKNKIVIGTAAAAAAVAAWVIWGNCTVGVTRYAVTDEKLPAAFEGFRIAVVSDLHDARFGKENRRLEALVREASPDLIAITGDVIDATRTDLAPSVSLVRRLAAIAPVYYVTGNHEGRIGDEYGTLERELTAAGATVLRDRAVNIRKGEEEIYILGLDDPRFTGDDYVDSAAVLREKLDGMALPAGYTVLLSHRPEAFGVYLSHGIDLALCGHAHGGQFRIPFLGGLFSPHQGFFPEHDAGVFTENGTTMVVSRGLGNSRFPFRLNNRPELVVAELFRNGGRRN